MRIVFWTGLTFWTGLVLLALAGAAEAQSPWTFQGIDFTPHPGWCPISKVLNGITTMEVRLCAGGDFPYLSAGIVMKDSPNQDMTKLLDTAATYAESAQGQQDILKLALAKDASCTQSSYGVERNTIPDTLSYTITSHYACTHTGNSGVDYHNTTAVIRDREGNIWGIALDDPGGALDEAKQALIKSMSADISAH